MTPITLEQYRTRETANPRARPITQDPIGAERGTVDIDGWLAARALLPVQLNPTTRRPPKEPAA